MKKLVYERLQKHLAEAMFALSEHFESDNKNVDLIEAAKLLTQVQQKVFASRPSTSWTWSQNERGEEIR